jgi:ADP-ribose pyrophosphatase YjhB (NUDIX family)
MRETEMPEQDPAAGALPSWLDWARRLQSRAQTGLTYSKDRHDIARYREIADIASRMMAEGSGLPKSAVTDLFRFETGHATPKIDVRVAVFGSGDDRDKILLVRERIDGRWTLPGGWADVNETPSEAAVREALEESGYTIRVTRLLAAWDKRKHPHPPQAFYVCKLVFEAELENASSVGGDGYETDGVDFFARNNLPPLSLDRILPVQIERLFKLHEMGPTTGADFD